MPLVLTTSFKSQLPEGPFDITEPTPLSTVTNSEPVIEADEVITLLNHTNTSTATNTTPEIGFGGSP